VRYQIFIYITLHPLQPEVDSIFQVIHQASINSIISV